MLGRTIRWTLLLCMASTAAAQERVTMRGRVLDGATGHAVTGASIELFDAGGDTVRTRSASDGRWSTSVNAERGYEGRVRALGFRARHFTMTASENVIELVPLPLALDRMVVTAARREQKLADVVVTTELVSAASIPAAGSAWTADAFAASRWYRYNLAGDNRISPTFDVYLIRRGSAVYKLQVLDYYSDTGAPRNITFRYQQIAN